MHKIVINKPVIKKEGDNVFLVSKVEDGILKTEKEYFFSVQEGFGVYLTHEVADAFVSALLMAAIMSGQDIIVKAPLSEVFYHNLENSLIYTICKAYNKPKIKVKAESLISPDFDPRAVSAGFSGGVDSFATVIQHTSKKCPKSLTLTHLTLMNVGSYGDSEVAFSHFSNDAIRSKEYAEKLKLPLVLINSNIGSAYRREECKRLRGFASRSIISLTSGILSLQKLYKYYFISSSRTIDEIKLSHSNQSYYEPLIASYLTTHTTRVLIANADMNRIDKTKYIADIKDVQERLYVCAADIYNEKQNKTYSKDGYPNCSECDKCTRTMLTLELLGKLDFYSNQFNIQKYKYQKRELYEQVFRRKNKESMYWDLYLLMQANNYTMPFSIKGKVYLSMTLRKIYRLLMRLNSK